HPALPASFSFCSSPPPPRPPLFPYTTLFRSQSIPQVFVETIVKCLLVGALFAWFRKRADSDQKKEYQGAVICSIVYAVLNIFIRSEEHTSELQSRFDLVCRLLLEKKKTDLRS